MTAVCFTWFESLRVTAVCITTFEPYGFLLQVPLKN